MPISSNVKENIARFQKLLRCERNFDIVYRTMVIGGKLSCMFFVDGFAKDEIIEKLMEFFYSVEAPEKLRDAHTFSQNCVPYCEVGLEREEEAIATSVLSGMMALFIEGFDQCILVDTRTYPQRSTAEPDKDRAFRGSRDGFVETLVLNTALVRRRIRDSRLCVENMKVGSRSKTDVAICYLEGLADEALLEKIRRKLQESKVEALTMNQESVAEILTPRRWYNPFPKFKYTERPDTTAAQLLEGDIVLLVDNSPAAMILPTSIFDIMEEANDYYFPPITGSYLRLTRFVVMILTVILTPTWLLLMQNPQMIPPGFAFIQISEPAQVPVLAQLLILEFAIDGLKLATLNTPNMLTTSLSMIGAIVVGDFAVQSGWVSAEAMLYMALVAIANYSQPEYELGYALKFMRLMLLLFTGVLNVWGYWIGMALFLLILGGNRTISGRSYLYPLFPFNYRDFKKKLLRIKIDNQ